MGRTHAAATRAGITLDSGALIALDRGDKRLIALLDRALAQRLKFRVLRVWWGKLGGMAACR